MTNKQRKFPITGKQRKFIEVYLKSKDLVEAAKEAGYHLVKELRRD